MHRTVFALAFVLVVTGLAGVARVSRGSSAQDAAGAAAAHPFVGTWVVDTIAAGADNSPEIAVVTADGGVVGQGANRSAGGRWEAVDDATAELTLVSVTEQAGVGGYIVVRGPHTVDETGDAWTCDCTFTVVGADGAVLDSGSAPASARRLPLQGTDLAGSALDEVPTWAPPMPDATPAP